MRDIRTESSSIVFIDDDGDRHVVEARSYRTWEFRGDVCHLDRQQMTELHKWIGQQLGLTTPTPTSPVTASAAARRALGNPDE